MTDFDRSTDDSAAPDAKRGPRLKDMMRQARLEAAERTGVVVDLHDAELARLEILNDALNPLFSEIPAEIDLFDRGVTPGDPPRLWVDMIAHVAMARDKRIYRFVQDTRYGRRVLAESADVAEMVKAITQYIARRLVERERALAGTSAMAVEPKTRPRRRWLGWSLAFLIGALAGVVVLFAAAWIVAGRG